MSRNGSGTYSAPASSWNPPVADTQISTTDWIALLADLTTAMSASIANDGQTTCSAVIPFAAGLSTANFVRFAATQVPSAGANDLDDYEEGTFTPTLTFGGGSTGLTFSAQVGRYVKIGRVCVFQINLVLSAKGSSSGNVTLGGLPFTSTAATNAYGCYSVFGDVLTSISGGLMAYTAPSSTGINLRQSVTGTATVLTEANLNNTSQIIISGAYETT